MKRMHLPLLVTIAALMGLIAPGSAGASTYTNPTSVVIPEEGVGSPYPSSISVAGVDGAVTRVRASLNNFHHSYPNDVAVLLVAPNGASTNLMTFVCGDGDAGEEATGQTFTFDDTAGSFMPDETFCPSGTYRPTSDGGFTFAPPAPSGPQTTIAMSALNGSPANGAWSLYVEDDAGDDAGVLAGGWTLDLLTDAKCSGEQATLTGTAGNDALAGTPGPDVILGFGGKDTIKGLSGKDTLCGGPGKDTLKGGKRKDELLGQGGKDKLRGGGGKDTCKGGKAADTAKSCEKQKSI